MQILKDSDSNNNEKDKKYYNNFLYSYKTEVTRKNSLSILKYYVKLLGVKTLRALVEKSQQIIESDIKAYLVYLRTKRKIYTLLVLEYILKINLYLMIQIIGYNSITADK